MMPMNRRSFLGRAGGAVVALGAGMALPAAKVTPAAVEAQPDDTPYIFDPNEERFTTTGPMLSLEQQEMLRGAYDKELLARLLPNLTYSRFS